MEFSQYDTDALLTITTRPPLVFVEGEGMWLTDHKGKRYLDYLQGWAVVENPSDEDWKDVRMALVSGRPISFQMDLYTPLYVQRPSVQLELFQSLRPVAYSGSLDKAKDQVAMGVPPGVAVPGGMPAMPGMAGKGGEAKNDAKGSYGRQLEEHLKKQMDLGSSVSSAAPRCPPG